MDMENERNGLEIAVIGMSCRFPGANNIKQYWENISKGVESIKFFSDEELKSIGIKDEMINNPKYVKANGVLENDETFDSEFFNYTIEESKAMHPQGRKLHECVWEALENSGYNPYKYNGDIGLYAGTGSSTMWETYLSLTNKNDMLGGFSSAFLSDKDYLISNISYRLNLTGPSISVKSACSTSLVAVHLACRALLTGECDMAIAGGATIAFGNRNGYLYEEGSVYSADGKCRPFDAEATGTVPSDGVGVVVLKTLENAIADGDHIYCIIKGSAVNGDGNNKVGYTAPSIEGQARVIDSALKMAEVDPNSIKFIETHGTGTSLGDVVEIEALKAAYEGLEPQSCALGAVKSNIGHLDSASGIAGFIKTALCLYNKMIVPTLHFKKSNPKINFLNSPFYVNTELKKWEDNNIPRRAGISSFGIGGTNVHLILEESQIDKNEDDLEDEELILLSTKTESALDNLCEDFIDYCKQDNDYKLSDIAYTLQVGRNTHKYRKFTVAKNLSEVICNFEKYDKSKVYSMESNYSNRPIVFMFPGQGVEYVNLGRELYEGLEPFRKEINKCFDILDDMNYTNIREILYPINCDENNNVINRIDIAPVINFIIEYSLARTLISLGIIPNCIVGHSIGEFTSACIAGVFSLESALKLVLYRGGLMSKLPSGRMMAVPLIYEDVSALIKDKNIFIATDHGVSCIVSGLEKDVEMLKTELMDKRLICQILPILTAGHSDVMKEITGDFGEILKSIDFKEPNIPIISTVTGSLVQNCEMSGKDYWLRHMTYTVRFADAIKSIKSKLGNPLFLEVGPGNVLTRVVNQSNELQNSIASFNMFKHNGQEINEVKYFFNRIGQVWLNGGEIDWDKFNSFKIKKRVAASTYPFEKRLYKFKNINRDMSTYIKSNEDGKNEFQDWFYLPQWKQKLLNKVAQNDSDKSTVYFYDDGRIADLLFKKLGDDNKKIIKVKKEKTFKINDLYNYEINPSDKNDFVKLISEIKKSEYPPNKFVFLWALREFDEEVAVDINSVCNAQIVGFGSIINLVKSLGENHYNTNLNVIYITNDVQKVYSHKVLYPELATVLGTIKIIPKEYPNINCSSIDISLFKRSDRHIQDITEKLLKEIKFNSNDNIVAYRDNQRLVQTYDAIEIKDTNEAPNIIKDNKVYLVIGGIGGIGFTLSKYIVNEIKNSTLILMQRTYLPPKDEWNKILANESYDKNIKEIITNIKTLEINNNCIEIYSADISNEMRLKEVFYEIYLKHKEINGVIHCAGVNDGSLICNLTDDVVNKAFAAKVYGIVIIDKLIKKETLDFYFLSSSFNTLLSTIGTVGYTSANMFVDAFSNYKNDVGRIISKSINWFAWQEVGGAVKNIKNIFNNYISRDGFESEEKYPCLRSASNNESESEFSTIISSQDSWVLSEHKIYGNSVMPGTGYIDLISLVINRYYKYPKFRIYDICYEKPLVMSEYDKKKIKIFVKETVKNGFEFIIKSIYENRTDGWEINATGKFMFINDYEVKDKLTYEDTNIKSSINENEIKENKFKNQHVKFGHRWSGSIKNICIGKDKGILSLGLSEEYKDDLENHYLHPALFDIALATITDNDTFYMPFYFKNINVLGKLPSKFKSIVKKSKQDNNVEGLISYDYAIVDEYNNLLVEIEDYTLIDITNSSNSDNKFKGIINKKELQDNKNEIKESLVKESLKNGILPKEGVKIFKNIINTDLRQVIVCPLDIDKKLSQSSKEDYLDYIEIQDENSTKMTDKRTLSNAYVEPKINVEKRIAEIWRITLGLDKVGVYDNFFDLGANSLTIIQVNRRMQKEFNKEFSVVNYYVYPTIHELANFISKDITDECEEEVVSNQYVTKNKLNLRRKNISDSN